MVYGGGYEGLLGRPPIVVPHGPKTPPNLAIFSICLLGRVFAEHILYCTRIACHGSGADLDSAGAGADLRPVRCVFVCVAAAAGGGRNGFVDMVRRVFTPQWSGYRYAAPFESAAV